MNAAAFAHFLGRVIGLACVVAAPATMLAVLYVVAAHSTSTVLFWLLYAVALTAIAVAVWSGRKALLRARAELARRKEAHLFASRAQSRP